MVGTTDGFVHLCKPGRLYFQRDLQFEPYFGETKKGLRTAISYSFVQLLYEGLFIKSTAATLLSPVSRLSVA